MASSTLHLSQLICIILKPFLYAEKTDVPQRESTPKSMSAYQRQVELFRMLHPCASDNETFPLDKGNRTFRVQCINDMGLDSESRKVFFGGKVKVAIEVACMSRRCYECITQVFEKMGNFPGLINTSLFREECGFKDEPKLFSLLKAFAEGSISKKDFNKAVSDAKRKNQDKVREKIEMVCRNEHFFRSEQ